ncbi:MAG: nucleotidyl transferase AbiEii/AbiGii toxin family protein [Candidatus Portnoybacteria bacterium]|nr:nucleotidyl transferase AbiEii/AbiGii toxin family protein [Candidatus Portnoybacteria bacterium]
MIHKYLFETIEEEGKRLGIPPDKKRALIREYLQSKMIFYLYEEGAAKNLSFIGGTSLRLLRDLDRFSEDLDFDNLNLSFTEVKKLFSHVKKKLEREGFSLEYKNLTFGQNLPGFASRMKKTNDSAVGELKFKDLLFRLGISAHSQENLAIRINYTIPHIVPATESLVLVRFGMVQSVVTNTAEFLLSQK